MKSDSRDNASRIHLIDRPWLLFESDESPSGTREPEVTYKLTRRERFRVFCLSGVISSPLVAAGLVAGFYGSISIALACALAGVVGFVTLCWLFRHCAPPTIISIVDRLENTTVAGTD